MIGKLKGKIDTIYDDHFIIDVNGVGYLVFCSAKTLHQLDSLEFAEILIETHVREDHIHLYGFWNSEEKTTFGILQSVKGVGTRMALAILSSLTPEDIQLALNTEDKTAFHAVSGVGKKLSERIITELKDKVISTQQLSAAGSRTTISPEANVKGNLVADAVSALTGLGVNKAEAYQRVTKLLAESDNISISDLIRLSLKN
ncbi:MAG: Holliday junction branch migration protein RuvA [Rickettsiaceae bacterium]